MSLDDDARPERATDPSLGATDANATEDDGATMTIEQRYELEKTLAGLELASEPLGVPIGTDERFVLRSLLGRGSMGAVYLAEDVELERRVAIKVVSRRVERGRLELRLRREARALAALDHPNVVKVFDIGKERGEPFIAMEHVAGRTLRDWQQGRRFAEVLDAYLQAGRGLAAAHARGLVHRDFKPDNALVDEHEGRLRVRVGDFGLAGDEPELPAVDAIPTGSTGVGSRTEHRGLLGTLVYMAPEQLRRERADARSDQYQLCVALWEAVVGSRPFEATRPLTGSTAVPPCPPTMPRWLHRVLRRGLAFAAEDRFPSVHTLLAAIERGRFVQRAAPWVAGLGVAAVVPFAVWAATRSDPCEGATEPMAAVWNDEARADVEAAFGLRDAAQGEYIVDRLDRVAEQWSAQALAVCEARVQAPAAEQHGLQTSAECLERWVERMESRVAWLREPDETRMDHAYELVASLTLGEGACTVPPVMLDREVEAAIDLAEQTELLRDLDDALGLARAAVDLAASTNTSCDARGPDGERRSSEQAAALFRLGHVLTELGKPGDALTALTASYEHANACRDEHREAEARVHAAKVLSMDLHDLDAADEALDDAWVALEHVKEPEVSLRRYEERSAATAVAMLRRDSEAAQQHAEEARAALGDPTQEPVLAAKLELNVGVVEQMAGHYAEAGAAYERATELMALALGPDHPQTRLYAERRALNLGLVARKSKDYPGMRERLEIAAASSEPSVAIKALTAWTQGEHEARNAQAIAARAMALADRLDHLARGSGVPPITLATAELTAGQFLMPHDLRRGIELLERACPRWHGLDVPKQTVNCEIELGFGLHEAGRLDEAWQALGRLRGLPIDEKGPLPAAIAELEALLRAPNPSLAPPEPPADPKGRPGP